MGESVTPRKDFERESRRWFVGQCLDLINATQEIFAGHPDYTDKEVAFLGLDITVSEKYNNFARHIPERAEDLAPEKRKSMQCVFAGIIVQERLRQAREWIEFYENYIDTAEAMDVDVDALPALNVRREILPEVYDPLVAQKFPPHVHYALKTSDEVFLLGASTFIIFAFVLAAALWIASRVARPLQDLTAAAQKVGAAGEPQEVTVQGPGDVRQTLEAFNAMSRRVSHLLGEKDVMLGALGHDLRTPLASLRIRLENMEPEAERVKAIRTIEEASELLEDILELARQGRSKEPVQTMDIAILVQDMVEDYAETGAPVSLSSFVKGPVACRPVLFRRALRNLIDNAVSYGERARLSVTRANGEVLVRVEDDGPGMSAEALASAADPFYRGDASRNRTTGGAGLGLTLADAIAKAHGGSLALENRTPRGFAATIKLPDAMQGAT